MQKNSAQNAITDLEEVMAAGHIPQVYNSAEEYMTDFYPCFLSWTPTGMEKELKEILSDPRITAISAWFEKKYQINLISEFNTAIKNCQTDF